AQVLEEDDNLFCHLLRPRQNQSFLIQRLCLRIVTPFLCNNAQLCEQRNSLGLITCLIGQLQSFLGILASLDIVSLCMSQRTQLFPQDHLIVSIPGMIKCRGRLLQQFVGELVPSPTQEQRSEETNSTDQ